MENKGQNRFSGSGLTHIKNCFKVFIFFVIGILIFLTIQYILIPKRFVYTKYYDAGKLTGFYAEEI